jgi:hypothetical protein
MEGSVYTSLRAAIRDDLRAFRSKRSGNCQADAGGRTRHDGEFSL